MRVRDEVRTLRKECIRLRFLLDAYRDRAKGSRVTLKSLGKPPGPTELALKVMDNEWIRLRASSSRGLRNYRKQKEGQLQDSGPKRERSLTTGNTLTLTAKGEARKRANPEIRGEITG